MNKKAYKLASFIDLMRIVERGFIHKLKDRRPEITEDELAQELKRWYLDRPKLEHCDPDIVPGDVKRFL
jgi:hypothetical protein